MTPNDPTAGGRQVRFAIVELDEPIVRGEQIIDKITIRKPEPGALRGLNLSEVLAMSTNAIMAILPRISDPMLTPHEVAQLDAADLVALGGEVAGFLLPKAVRAQASLDS